MNKYIEAIKRKLEESTLFIFIAYVIALYAFAAFVSATIATRGLTLLAPLLWWGYIVYKEANKDDT